MVIQRDTCQRVIASRRFLLDENTRGISGRSFKTFGARNLSESKGASDLGSSAQRGNEGNKDRAVARRIRRY